MSFVCLAVTMVLFISLFLYFRQKVLALEEKITLLSEVTTTMAGITTLREPVPQRVDLVHDSESESEEEEEYEFESESESESEDDESLVESPVMTFSKVNSDIKNVIVMNHSNPMLDSFVQHMFTEIKLESPVEDLKNVYDLTNDDLEEVHVAPVVEDVPVVEEVRHSQVVELKDDPVVEVEEVPVVEVKQVDVGLPKRVVSTDEVKTLTLDSPYEAMTVKELKDKVAETNGPKLKTKKELIEYLKNKM